MAENSSQAESIVDSEPHAQQLQQKLTHLTASATQQYSLKKYASAAEFFSEAAEVQDRINGEMSPANADLLYQYGRCLYHVAVANSDVLGGKVAGTEEPKRKKRRVGTAGDCAAPGHALNATESESKDTKAQEVVEAGPSIKPSGHKGAENAGVASKPFFEITGDENWTDSEEDDEAADAEAEEEEDDFAIAYEILDVARVLLTRKLDVARETGEAETGMNFEYRQLKERLADTHDLQAEISLENERFADAVNDTRESLALKLQIFPPESSLVAEAHFKLSLALEFASVTKVSNEEAKGEMDSKSAQVDKKMRAEAAAELEKAIASCKLRISKETAALPSVSDAAKQKEQEKLISDVKEMIADMEQRLVDLRSPAVSLTGGSGLAGASGGDDQLRGMLGAILGESKEEQQKKIKEATEGANDLSGLVKHKKKPKVDTDSSAVSAGKRKAFDEPAGAEESGSEKKLKLDRA